jgi:hypothetical protein
MFKKIIDKILLAIKAIPQLCVALIKQLLKLLFAAFFYGLSLAFLLIGISIIGAHTYMFLKTGDWTLVATPDMPFTVELEAQWIGAWKIYTWLPASLIFMAVGIGIFFVYLKIKTVILKMVGTEASTPAPEPVASAK